jgi:hypothetical protein
MIGDLIKTVFYLFLGACVIALIAGYFLGMLVK